MPVSHHEGNTFYQVPQKSKRCIRGAVCALLFVVCKFPVCVNHCWFFISGVSRGSVFFWSTDCKDFWGQRTTDYGPIRMVVYCLLSIVCWLLFINVITRKYRTWPNKSASFFAYFEKSVWAIEFCLLGRGCGFVKPHPQKTTFNLERKNNMEGCASKYRYSTLKVKSSGLPF